MADEKSELFNRYFKQAEQAYTQQNLEKAYEAFEQCLILSPGNATIEYNMGLVAYHRQDLQTAERHLKQSLSKGARRDAFVLLGDICEATGRDNEAFACYKNALKIVPDDLAALEKLGDLKRRLGDVPGARQCYRLAHEAHPDEISVAIKYSNYIFGQEPATSVDVMEKLLGRTTNLDARSKILEAFLSQKEWYERIKRGLMDQHAHHIDELFFTYAQPFVKDYEETNRKRLAIDPENHDAKYGLGFALFSGRDRHGAETCFRSSSKASKAHIIEVVRFAPEFYQELSSYSDADLTKNLPPLISVTPIAPSPKGVLYLSCDHTYFHAFALPMIYSLREKSPDIPVHMHLMDATEEQVDFIHAIFKKLAPLRFAISVERPGLKNGPKSESRGYYHAVRFIRFYQHLKEYQCPLWLMDVDALFNRDVTPMFAALDKDDIALRVRPGRIEPWNQFNACIVGAKPTERSLEYFRLISAYVAYFHKENKLRWGIDQLAMYAVYEDLKDRGLSPAFGMLGTLEVDYVYLDDGYVWCNSGAAKFRHLQRIANPNSLPLANFEGNRFVDVFEAYWKEVQKISVQAREDMIAAQK